ncbi:MULTISPECIES: hypothetical protein [unclassified Arsukibacterium]|uniref:hypothetical protein n=1 Tax=unclassified Arsukibacterium TaxID=2635278 RepID=UPI000C6A11B2|nr:MULTISPECIES: hypothetical protein [unclassified Arsukibacterium]MAA96109.1 hypothetical protein [Rheinheimera sp.]MBM35457.1 hypothetical protein [Rheinheimera sp.]HAW93625.1 hypothetical protein [Candidatus Azambacteria bacterium]|tara:strand:- start:17173 stop:18903 length:1731 start_codon:yes stop_codon:yes gene_type:complete
MSIQYIIDQLQHYVDNKKPGVFAVVGDWGVGKTYLWTTFVQTRLIKARPKYSYVSLFGIDSVSNIEKEIFLNHVPIDKAANPADYNTVLTSIKKTGKKIQNSGPTGLFKFVGWVREWLGGIPLISQYISGFDIPLYKLMPYEDTLICFDDIERLSNALSLDEILGLIERLKTTKKAQIVLLLNSNKIQSDIYKRYKEKVVDYELVLKPTAAEAFEVAFHDLKHELAYDTLSEVCCNLNICNIRILLKLKSSVEQILPILQGKHPDTFSNVLNPLVLIQLSDACSASQPDTVPTLNYIKSHTLYGLFDEKLTQQEKIWNKTLLDAGFDEPGPIFDALVDGITSGIHDKSKLVKHIDQLEAQAQFNRRETSYRSALIELNSGFSNCDAKERVRNLYLSAKEHLPCIHIKEFNDICYLMSLFDEFGNEISLFVTQYLSKINSETLASIKSTSGLHPAISSSIESFVPQEQPEITVKQALYALAINRIDTKYLEIAPQASEEDYYELLMRKPDANNLNLDDAIPYLLRFGVMHDASDQGHDLIYQDIYNKTCRALRRHGSESPLNQFLVEKHLGQIDIIE